MSGVRVVSWALWLGFGVALAGATYTGTHPAEGKPISIWSALWAVSFIGFPTAGAIVVSRLPRRPLGWMLLVAPFIIMMGLFLGELSRHFYDAPASAAWLLWVASVGIGVGLGTLVCIPLFLPNGELPGPGWRWVGRMAALYVALMGIDAAFLPGPFEDGPRFIQNPLGLEPLAGVLAVSSGLLGPFTLVVLALGVASLVIRFRRSRGTERQQLKWLALGATTMLTTIAAVVAIESLGVNVGEAVITLGFVIAFLCMPVSIAIAVMKTRLYDVDVVINKTLVYVTLSAILALSYLVIVVALQRMFGGFIRGSDLFVAGSTLAVAALFRPLRGRVQGFIDHSFYRRKYDAAETLEVFSARLRDQVNLDSLSSELVRVVGTTMQPEHLSIWLRQGVTR